MTGLSRNGETTMLAAGSAALCVDAFGYWLCASTAFSLTARLTPNAQAGSSYCWQHAR